MGPEAVARSYTHNQTDTKEQILKDFEQILTIVPDNHYFPKPIMRKLLDKYSSDDLQLIYHDYTVLLEKTFTGALQSKEYVVTAGAPGAGKSTLLEKMIGFDFATGSNKEKVVYIDPDRAVMQQMPSYLEDRRLERRDAKAAYEHWREASNFIAQVFLAKALVEGYKIAHGNTMSVDQSITNLQAIQNMYGYKTRLIHCTASDAIRMEREQMRQEGGMFQVTAEDFAQKSVKFFSLLPRYVEVTACDFYISMNARSNERAATKEPKNEAIIERKDLFDEIIRLHKEKGVQHPESCFM